MAQLGAQLRDTGRMDELRRNIERHRSFFTFDHHADDLVAFFRRVIAERQAGNAPANGVVAEQPERPMGQPLEELQER